MSDLEDKLSGVSSTLERPNLWLSASLDGGLQEQLKLTKVITLSKNLIVSKIIYWGLLLSIIKCTKYVQDILPLFVGCIRDELLGRWLTRYCVL